MQHAFVKPGAHEGRRFVYIEAMAYSVRPWLLILLIALLPLRGWGAVVMGTAMAAAPVASAAQDQAMPPCHAEPADAAPAQDAAHQACSLCALCHSGMAPAPGFEAPRADAPAQAPPARAMRDTGRLLVDLLERPPRG